MSTGKCICEWPDDCGASGVRYCAGCGGDLCVCRCGGEADCEACFGGCDMCGDVDDRGEFEGLDYGDPGAES